MKKKLNLKKRSNFFLVIAPLLFLTKICLQAFLYTGFLCINYIIMFIKKRFISTRGVKNLASKLRMKQKASPRHLGINMIISKIYIDCL